MKEGVEMQKKQFYITELEMGEDGLEDTTDYGGPFTLSKARKIMEKMFRGRSFNNFYNMTIRGPVREVESVCGTHNYKSPWYSDKEKN
jgi:hypothetical protein